MHKITELNAQVKQIEESNLMKDVLKNATFITATS